MGSTSPSILSSRTEVLTAFSSADAEGNGQQSARAQKATRRNRRGAMELEEMRARTGFITRHHWALRFADVPAIVWLPRNWGPAATHAAPRRAPGLVFSARGRCARASCAPERNHGRPVRT